MRNESYKWWDARPWWMRWFVGALIAVWLSVAIFSAVFGIITSLPAWLAWISVVLVLGGWWGRVVDESESHYPGETRWWEEEE